MDLNAIEANLHGQRGRGAIITDSLLDVLHCHFDRRMIGVGERARWSPRVDESSIPRVNPTRWRTGKPQATPSSVGLSHGLRATADRR